MDKRKILLDVISDGKCYTAEYISECLDTGTKTVRNMIRELNQNQLEGATICSKYGAGYYLNITDAEAYRNCYCHSFQMQQDAYIPDTSEERIQFLFEYLFFRDTYVKLDELSDMLFISKRTLTTDIGELEVMLKRYNITLNRKPNHGIRLEGQEFDKRMCVAAFYGKRFKKGNQIMDDIDSMVERILTADNFSISGAAYQNLVIHLYVAVSRLEEEQQIILPDSEIEELRADREYVIAKKIANGLEELFSLKVPQSEIAYIAIHLTCKKIVRVSDSGAGNIVISQEISDIVTEMLHYVYEMLQFDFRDDLELRMSLCQHIIPLYARIKYKMKLKNPLLEEVKKQYCLPYMIACNAVIVLNNYYSISLSEDEVAYFAFAFALAMERKKTKIQKKNILLVCASGRGSAKLLQYKYQTEFGAYINEVTACDVGSLHTVDYCHYDYIFTTVPIPIKVPIPIQEVEYFLSDRDTEHIKKILKSGQLSAVQHYFPQELFLTDLSFKTKDDVLEHMCRTVMDEKKLSEKFYQSVLEREKLAQTAFGNMVAMPHCFEPMSDETFVCVGILENPVKWGNQMVQAVFLVSISSKDFTSDELQNFYQMVASYLLDPKRIQQLIRKHSYHKFLEEMGEIKESL